MHFDGIAHPDEEQHRRDLDLALFEREIEIQIKSGLVAPVLPVADPAHDSLRFAQQRELQGQRGRRRIALTDGSEGGVNDTDNERMRSSLHGLTHLFIATRLGGVHFRGFDLHGGFHPGGIPSGVGGDSGHKRFRSHFATPAMQRGSAIKGDLAGARPVGGAGQCGTGHETKQTEKFFHNQNAKERGR